MNHAEILGFANEYRKLSGEDDEPGTSSTRIHIPIGIPTKKRSRREVRMPRQGEFDKMFGARSVNDAIRRDEILRPDELEDALNERIDELYTL